jgi:hypothetical protein
MEPSQQRSQIKQGMRVRVVMKQDQRSGAFIKSRCSRAGYGRRAVRERSIHIHHF